MGCIRNRLEILFMKKTVLAILGMLLFLHAAVPLRAQAGYAASAALDEYLVKGSLLINIPKFVTFPASALSEKGPFVIGVLGNNPFSDVLEDLARKGRIQGRTVTVRYPKKVSDAGGCHLLYIGVSEGKRVAKILKALRGKSILTVSDVRDFAGRGGMVGLVSENNRVQFEINPEAFRKGGLKAGTQLTKLASRVIPEEGP